MKPVSKTAFYCCGVRMVDAEQRRPLCGDNYAKRFMDAEARAFYEPFRSETDAARGNATRHRIIDDYLRGAIGALPGLTIITIGAGFDTRPYRLHAGTWIELDEPAVIALKNQRLPVSECKNKLTRIAIDFASERLEDKLTPLKTDGACIIVLEGVLMYLEQSVIGEMLTLLGRLFPNHTLLCDLMVRSFADKHSQSLLRRIEQLGATFRAVEDPYAVFAQHQYRAIEQISVLARVLALTVPRWLRPLTRLVPKEMFEGYQIAVFTPRLS